MYIPAVCRPSSGTAATSPTRTAVTRRGGPEDGDATTRTGGLGAMMPVSGANSDGGTVGGSVGSR